jgi:hypothetical protein
MEPAWSTIDFAAGQGVLRSVGTGSAHRGQNRARLLTMVGAQN